MLDLAELGRRVWSLRKERGLTLHELAATAAVSVSMLSSVERGQKAATIVVLARIADGLGVPLPELITAEGNRVIIRRAAGQDVVDEPGAGTTPAARTPASWSSRRRCGWPSAAKSTRSRPAIPLTSPLTSATATPMPGASPARITWSR